MVHANGAFCGVSVSLLDLRLRYVAETDYYFWEQYGMNGLDA